MPSAPTPAHDAFEKIKYYWEDLAVGSRQEVGSVQATKEQMLAFSTQFDPQPFHIDEVAARESIFGSLCASGWHTCAMAMRLIVDKFLNQSSSLGSPGLETLKWLKPVFPGDTLTMSQTILESRALKSRADVGLVRTQWEMVNQHGEKVLHIEANAMFRRRHPASSTE
jgi:acyl dehydratase